MFIEFLDSYIKLQASSFSKKRFSRATNGSSNGKKNLSKSINKRNKSITCNSPKSSYQLLVSSAISSAGKNKDITCNISQLNKYDITDLSPILQKEIQKNDKTYEELQVEVEKWKKFGRVMADSYDELNNKFNLFLKDQETDKKIIAAFKQQVYYIISQAKINNNYIGLYFENKAFGRSK